MKGKLIVILGLVACLVMFFCFPAAAEQKLASSIRAYLGAGPENGAAIVKFIEDTLGVKVKYSIMSVGELGAKLEAEAPRFNADMVITAGTPQAAMAKEKGWSVPYASPNWQGAGDVFVDPDNHWFNIGNWSFVLVGNKDLLAKKGYKMPKGWDDLLDPKWKGQVVMPSPLSSGTAYMMVYSFMTLYGFNANKGEEGGWEFLKKLDKNVHHYTKSGVAPLELVSRGEFLLGITSDETVLPRIKEGYPIQWVIPKEGIGYDGGPGFILKGCKEPYTCRKIVDLLGTKEFSALYASFGNITKDVPSALYGEKSPKFIPNIDLGWASKNRKRLCAEWKDRFLRK